MKTTPLDEAQVVSHSLQLDVGIQADQIHGVDPILKTLLVHGEDLGGEELLAARDRNAADALDGDRCGPLHDLRLDPELAASKSTFTPVGERRRTVARRFVSSRSTSATRS